VLVRCTKLKHLFISLKIVAAAHQCFGSEVSLEGNSAVRCTKLKHLFIS
jgi:hypothetical protein